MRLRVLLLLTIALAVAGCGGTKHAGGTSPEQTVATSSSEVVACQRLRADAVSASTAIGRSLRRLTKSAPRSVLASELRKLQAQFTQEAQSVGAVAVTSPQLQRDRRQLVAALRGLAQVAGRASTAVAGGKLAVAAQMNATGVRQLRAAAVDLSHRCAHLG
jgi:hypothetical protein